MYFVFAEFKIATSSGSGKKRNVDVIDYTLEKKNAKANVDEVVTWLRTRLSEQ
jgi:hypothetical protein